MKKKTMTKQFPLYFIPALEYNDTLYSQMHIII